MYKKNILPMTQEVFDEIARQHELWLYDNDKGHRADFTNSDLREIDMTNRHLNEAIFDDANMEGVDLSRSTFNLASFVRTQMNYITCEESSFVDCEFYGTQMEEAIFSKCVFNDSRFHKSWFCRSAFDNTNFERVYFYYTNFRNASFINANFTEALFFNNRFTYADLEGANFYKAKFNFVPTRASNFDMAINVSHPMACPSDGEFIGWKKCFGNVIVKLKIPADAKRSSAFGMKCRTNKAEVLEIQNLEGETLDISFANSDHDHRFIYPVGEIVEEPNFCEDRWKECAPGIHFFVDRKAAVDYEL